MNQRKAKLLRKTIGYKNNGKEKEEREYRTFVSATKLKNTYQFGAGGNIDIVQRPQESHQTECVSGGRKLYKELKKRLTRFGYGGSDLMEMPDEETINNFVNAAKAELKEGENNEL
jgi:hypothetical protein